MPAKGPGEFELIERLTRALGPAVKGPLVGIGDDAAVLARPEKNLAATVDMQVDGIHFDRRWISPEDLGRRLLAVNLSDLAAMGATPRHALVSLGVSDEITPEYLEAVYRGLGELAARWSVSVAGGNIARVPERLVLDLTLFGEVEGEGIRRSGAKPGDLLLATGWLGRAGAGLEALRRLGADAGKRFPELVGAYLRPEARVAEGLALAAGGATSAIDVSDGLASELHHLAKASGVGFYLEGTWLDEDRALAEGARFLGTPARDLALFGGGDYELLFTCPPGLRTKWPFARVLGRVTPATEGIRWEKDPIPNRGWDHLDTSIRNPLSSH
jgi:thiamine-monophosphate kinase